MSDDLLRDMQIGLVKQRREKGHRFYVLYFGADGHKYWSGPHRQDVAEASTAMRDRFAAGFIVEDRRYFEDGDPVSSADPPGNAIQAARDAEHRITQLENALHAYAPYHELLNGDE